jgi:hypothetical protein
VAWAPLPRWGRRIKLLRAADEGDVRAVEALLKAFVSVNARDEARQPARSQSPQRGRFFRSRALPATTAR